MSEADKCQMIAKIRAKQQGCRDGRAEIIGILLCGHLATVTATVADLMR